MNNAISEARSTADLAAVYEALDRVQAIVEFELDGTIISANQKFLELFGYSLDEIVGKSHRMFCDPEYARSPEYADFWERLRRGDYFCHEFKRVTSDGSETW